MSHGGKDFLSLVLQSTAEVYSEMYLQQGLPSLRPQPLLLLVLPWLHSFSTWTFGRYLSKPGSASKHPHFVATIQFYTPQNKLYLPISKHLINMLYLKLLVWVSPFLT